MNRPEDYETLTRLGITNKYLTELPFWINQCHKLQVLVCTGNHTTQLNNLPPKLETLICRWNKITQLNNLPLTLEILKCSNNPLEYNFKPTLENIRHYNNKQNKLPK